MKKEKTKVVKQMGAWKWMGVSVPFILFILHVLIQQDTRPFKEQIKRTAYVTTVAEPQTKMQLLGCFGHSSRYITEDAEGNRYDNKAVVDEDKIDCTGLISIDQHHAGYYIVYTRGEISKLLQRQESDGDNQQIWRLCIMRSENRLIQIHTNHSHN